MKDDELFRIERELAIPLPNDYRRAARDGSLDYVLNSHADAVIGINRAFRSGEFGDRAWPDTRLAFGEDGAGNFYCLDVESPRSEVLLRDHETLAVHVVGESLNLWLLDIEEE